MAAWSGGGVLLRQTTGPRSPSIAAMTQAQWLDLENSFSYRFAMDNVPRAIAQALLDVVDVEVSGRVGYYQKNGSLRRNQ